MKKLITAALAASLMAASVGSASAANWNSHDNRGNHNGWNNNGHSQQMRHHGWRHGGYLPAQYRHNAEVDWRRHHLRQPPRGYHWVQTDGDFVLVALTTGLILQAIANSN